VQELYRERLISNGFVEEAEEEKAVVLAIERETDNDATAAARVCDTPDAESKGIADNIIARRRSMQKEHIRELLMAKQKNKEIADSDADAKEQDIIVRRRTKAIEYAKELIEKLNNRGRS
jgi:hypothetical protein